jgi:hypothetical protein
MDGYKPGLNFNQLTGTPFPTRRLKTRLKCKLKINFDIGGDTKPPSCLNSYRSLEYWFRIPPALTAR